MHTKLSFFISCPLMFLGLGTYKLLNVLAPFIALIGLKIVTSKCMGARNDWPIKGHAHLFLMLGYPSLPFFMLA